ncbi:MAG: hypothetical protein OWU33_01855 [Firmicutes bacterium]|nr:hypothetical protein [Bacillota bacterium]
MARTDAQEAESLTRGRWRPDDVVWAHRHEAQPTALAGIVAQNAPVIVRLGWHALRFQTLDGQPWSVLAAVRPLPDATPGDWWGPIPGTQDRPTLPVRIVAMRQSPQRPNRHAGSRARRRAIRAIPSRKRHGKQPILS